MSANEPATDKASDNAPRFRYSDKDEYLVMNLVIEQGTFKKAAVHGASKATWHTLASTFMEKAGALRFPLKGRS